MKRIPEPIINSHDLANELLKHPNMPLTIVCMGHHYDADHHGHSHGPIRIGTWKTNYRDSPRHLFLGEIIDTKINGEQVDWLFNPQYTRPL